MANYFGDKEEKAVEMYLSDRLNQIEKDRLYEEKLKEPIDTLVESILGIYGKKYNIFDTGLSFERLKLMGLSYLFKKMHKFEPERGCKAYSFFGTILRNYYLKLKQDYDTEQKRKLNIHNDKLMEPWEEDYLSYEENCDSYQKIFMKKLIRWYDSYIDTLFDKEDEKEIGHAILEILKNVDSLECFNKKYIYVQIREMTGIEDTYKITPIIKKMKTAYKHLKYNFKNNGELISGSLSL